MKRKALIAIMALAGLAAGCTYPFEAKIESAHNLFVIEGDINIGSLSKFSLTYAMALDDYSMSMLPRATVWVEGEDGTKYPSVEPAKSYGNFTVDMTDAPDNCRYRLVVENHDNDKKYLSRWEEVHMPPVLDTITYKISENKQKMDFFISFHSDDENSRYFRWNYAEEWEYRAPIQAHYYYVKPTLSDSQIRKILNNEAAEKIPSQVYGQILPFDEKNPSTFLCWDHHESQDIMIASTEDLGVNRIVNKQYESIPYTSTRVNYHYRTTIMIQSMSRDCYQYWVNILQNSENTGGLDSPVPSQMVGNLYCEDDPDEMVIGYVNVSRIAKFPRYISFYSTYFFKYAGSISESVPTVAMEQWYESYKLGLLPVGIMGYASPTEPLYGWAAAKCVLCSAWLTPGHTSKRPEDWPEKWPTKD